MRHRKTVGLSEASRLLNIRVDTLRARVPSQKWGVRAWSHRPMKARLADVLAHRDQRDQAVKETTP